VLSKADIDQVKLELFMDWLSSFSGTRQEVGHLLVDLAVNMLLTSTRGCSFRVVRYKDMLDFSARENFYSRGTSSEAS